MGRKMGPPGGWLVHACTSGGNVAHIIMYFLYVYRLTSGATLHTVV